VRKCHESASTPPVRDNLTTRSACTPTMPAFAYSCFRFGPCVPAARRVRMSASHRFPSDFRPSAAEFEEAIKEAIKGAKDICMTGGTAECAVAWDIVEELSAAAADAKAEEAEFDPLENYCDDNPAADECRTYDL